MVFKDFRSESGDMSSCAVCFDESDPCDSDKTGFSWKNAVIAASGWCKSDGMMW